MRGVICCVELAKTASIDWIASECAHKKHRNEKSKEKKKSDEKGEIMSDRGKRVQPQVSLKPSSKLANMPCDRVWTPLSCISFLNYSPFDEQKFRRKMLYTVP